MWWPNPGKLRCQHNPALAVVLLLFAVHTDQHFERSGFWMSQLLIWGMGSTPTFHLHIAGVWLAWSTTQMAAVGTVKSRQHAPAPWQMTAVLPQCRWQWDVGSSSDQILDLSLDVTYPQCCCARTGQPRNLVVCRTSKHFNRQDKLESQENATQPVAHWPLLSWTTGPQALVKVCQNKFWPAFKKKVGGGPCKLIEVK